MNESKSCDVCKDPNRPVTTYSVTAKGQEATAVRCAEHGTELEAILSKVRRRGGRPSLRVVSIEDVERSKRQQ